MTEPRFKTASKPIELSAFDLGWVVGIMDGEGWFGARACRPVAQLVMTDEDVVLRMREVTGLGSVTGPHDPKDGVRKLFWKWSITSRDDAAEFMRALKPHMSIRRQARIAEILADYEQAGPTRGTAPTCARGHDISEGSENLRLITDKNGYTRRRCLACATARQAGYRSRK